MNIQLWKKRQKELGYTYKQISEIAGVSKRSVEDIFRGFTRTPRIDTVQAIERALEIGDITTEEYEQGARYTKKVSITADEEDILDEAREVMELLGTKGKDLIIDFCKVIKEKYGK